MILLRKLLKPVLLRVLPQAVLSTLATEWHMFVVRRSFAKLRQDFSNMREMLVNIGSGHTGRAGWVNIDAYASPTVTCLVDCRYDLPFSSESVRGIYSEHFLEHLRYPTEALHFLQECFRSMRPGAVIRVVVPDAEAYLNAYTSPGWERLSHLRPLNAGHQDPWGNVYATKMELINEIFRQNDEHKYAYDVETLARLMASVGFQEVRRAEFRKSIDPELGIDLPSRASESLYIEARRGPSVPARAYPESAASA